MSQRITKYIPDTVHVYGDVPNEPIHNVEVIREGYYNKVTARLKYPDGRCYDWNLRTQVLIDTAREFGIKKGAIIPVPLIFANAPNGVEYLLPVGGEEYNELKQLDKLRSERVIKDKNLVPGGVYISLNGSKGVYLGQVKVLQLYSRGDTIVTWDDDVSSWKFWFEGIDRYQMPQRGSFTKWLEKRISEMNCYDFDRVARNTFNLKRSHSYRKQIAKMTVDPDYVIVVVKRLLPHPGWNPTPEYFLEFSRFFTMSTGTPEVDNQTRRWFEERGCVVVPPSITIDELPELLTHKEEEVRKFASKKLKEIQKYEGKGEVK